MIPDGYIARRRLNWLSLAFLYGSFYALRYNLSLANKPIRDEFDFSKAEFGLILTATYVAYAFGQFVNGPIVDRFGGKRMMLVGAVGTIVSNILFGLNAYTGVLNLFILVWILNGYTQAYGAPGNRRVNSAWVGLEQRGTFSGLFSAVVYMGRFFIMLVGPIIIAYTHWKWVFFFPSMIASLVAIWVLIFVRETPERAGFDVNFAESKIEEGERVNFWTSLKVVFRSRALRIMGLAYFANGVVRNGLEQWFPSYLSEVHGIPQGSVEFGMQAVLMPVAALLGAIFAGVVSDKIFNSRRGPIVALMYFGQAVLLVLFLVAVSPRWCGATIIMLSFMFSGPHSLIGTAAAMDFGGKEAAATAGGVVDAMQYIGAALVGVGMGRLIDFFGWGAWGPSLIVFAVMGGVLMCMIWREGGAKGKVEAEVEAEVEDAVIASPEGAAIQG